MDYKNMETKELLHLISNQVGNEEVSEQNKLVIQNCCKELFDKKCDSYVKVYYYKIKRIKDRYKCPTGDCCDCENPNCAERITHPLIKCDCKNKSKIMRRNTICKVITEDGCFLPNCSVISAHNVKSFNNNNYYVEDFTDYDCCIIKIEEIEI
jgi:hypothetical protein